MNAMQKKAVARARKLQRETERRDLCFENHICYECAGKLKTTTIRELGFFREVGYCPKCKHQVMPLITMPATKREIRAFKKKVAWWEFWK